ncbi:MAG: insulinase family protein, partial [Deltaproteobacteria bacterium]|nr:insulinase family protein [Deltaproteobacteria bacterium]
EGKAGLAHFVEHMMFQWSGPSFWGKDPNGKPIDGPALFNVLPQIAVGYNAYTNWDTTHYYLQGTKEDLPKLLDLEARRMRSAIAAAKDKCTESLLGVPRTQFNRELEVVRNEIRWRSGNTDGQVYQMVMDLAFPKGHPYHQMIGGNDTQLETIEPKDVCEFLGKYYIPQMATLLVAGNVDADETAKLVKGYFGPIKKGKPGKVREVPKVALKYKKIVKELDVERPQVNVVWALPDMNSKDWPAAQTMVSSLASRASYFLDQFKVARAINFQMLGGKRAPIFVITAELYKEDDIDDALEFIWKAAAGAHRGTDGLEMSKEAKNRAKASIVSSLESLSARTGMVAEMIQFSNKTEFSSKKDYLLEAFKEIDTLSESDYSNYIKREMKKNKAIVLVVKRNPNISGADKRGKTMFAADPHETNRKPIFDPSEADRPLSYPKDESIINKAERYQLKNGMKVVLLPTNSMPIVRADLRFAVGAAHEPANKAGLASLAAGRLKNMATQMSLGKLGVSVFGYAGMDETVFVGRGMDIYLEFMLKGMERTLAVGDYEQEAIETWRERFKAAHKLESVRANEAWSNAMAAAVYGPEHAWTLKGSATSKTIGNLGRDAAKAWAKKHFVAKNATLTLVGSFDPAVAKKHIAEYMGAIPGGKADAPISAPFQAKGSMALGVVKKKDPQTTLQIRYRGPVGVNEDEMAARMILGQMLNQRMSKMRTKLGSTYGAYAGVGISNGPRAYQLGGSFDTLRVGESLAAMRKEVNDLRQG